MTPTRSPGSRHQSALRVPRSAFPCPARPPGLTPFLDGLARRGTLFERAYAASSWTVPSIASLLTSRYPTQHGALTFVSRLPEEEVTLPERLRDAGWIGGAFSANPNLRPEAGFGQGLDELWRPDKPEVPGDTLRSHVLARLDRTWDRSAGPPALLYLQYMEPHEPYDPPEPFRSRFMVDDDGKPFDVDSASREALAAVLAIAGRAPTGMLSDDFTAALAIALQDPAAVAELKPVKQLKRLQANLYNADVASADEQIRLLFDELERRGFLDDTVVVVTSDHGEELGEHGGTGHGKTLYEESVRVPLIVIGPGIPAGRWVAENVRLLDLAPTLLELLDVPAEPRFEGRSLVPLMRAVAEGKRGDEPDVILQLEPLLPKGNAKELKHTRGLVRRERKMLVRGDSGSELYDLATDPGETRAMSGPPDEQAATMQERLSLVDVELGAGARAAPPVPLDAAQESRLRALGYLR